MKTRTILASLALAAAGFAGPVLTASSAAAANCVKISDHISINGGNFTGRVYSRDCNSGIVGSRWWEVYAVRGTNRVPNGNCGTGPGNLIDVVYSFLMNDGGGVSHTFRVRVGCKQPTVTVYRNVDSLIGKTYPTHRSFGIRFHPELAKFPDKITTKQTNLG